MKMRNILPAALAVALTVVAGLYMLREKEIAPAEIAPLASDAAMD